MRAIKSTHLQTLVELLLMGGKEKPIKVSTIALGRRIGKSQQAASKHLLELEEGGYVERRKGIDGSFVKLTQKGLDSMRKLHIALRTALEEKVTSLEIGGVLFTGLGEGAYYVSMRGYRKQFISRLGFDPFPGTLNLRLTSSLERGIKRDLAHLEGIGIEGFEDGERTFGGAKCFRARVEEKIEGAVLIIERTHYDDSVIEVISPVEIRESLGIKDGAKVGVKIFLTTN